MQNEKYSDDNTRDDCKATLHQHPVPLDNHVQSMYYQEEQPTQHGGVYSAYEAPGKGSMYNAYEYPSSSQDEHKYYTPR